MSPSITDKQKLLESELEKKLESIISEEQESAAAQEARRKGIPFSNLQAVPIDPEALAILEEPKAREASVAVVYKNGLALIVAVLDLENPATKAALETLQQKGFVVKTLLTTAEALERTWQRYQTIKTTELFEVGAIEINEVEFDRLYGLVNSLGDLKNQVTELPATQLLEILTAGALKMEASDIHFEPETDKVRLRYRLDGLLQDVTDLDPELYQRVLNRIKVLAKLKLNVHHTPQDGRFTIRQENLAIEVRVSILPSEYGETIVMRLLDPRTIRTKLEELGMRSDILKLVTDQIQKPNGALLTTGPTGSGKTTTLYAFVNSLNKPDTKIITIEDPIEYHIEGISQSQVDTSKDYTFANGLRSIVRQDPDIILIGEIRDFETAEIALNAALTGHLVLSTIHTNDAAGTIPRLIDLGVRPVTIAPAISMAMGQRLVRRLCEYCKTKGSLPPEELGKIKQELEPIRTRFNLSEINEKTEVNFPGGCGECNQLGYKGRIGIYEVFAVSKEMEKLIHTSPATSDIRDLAVKEGMVTMLQDAYMKLLEGITSIEEIHRIVA